MENSQQASNQPITMMTIADLEATIVKIVQQLLKQEIEKLKHNNLTRETVPKNNPPQAFLETFGSWEDTRTAEEIIDDIYTSRTLPSSQESL